MHQPRILFGQNFELSFRWMNKTLRIGGYACFVIGDSILKGQILRNDQLLIEIAKEMGYMVEANWIRRLQDNKKSLILRLAGLKMNTLWVCRNVGS